MAGKHSGAAVIDKVRAIPKDRLPRFTKTVDKLPTPSLLRSGLASGREYIADLDKFLAKSREEKLLDIAKSWAVKYYKVLFKARTQFEHILRYFRYVEPEWEHTHDIAKNFPGADFYKAKAGGVSVDSKGIINIEADEVVSVKTTTVTDVDNWLKSKPIKDTDPAI